MGKKAAKPKKPAAHPPSSAMVKAAIKALADKKGSSLAAIKKYIAANYKVDIVKISPFIRKALKKGVEGKALIQVKGSYKLAKEAKKPKAKKPKKPKAKKPKKPKAKKVKKAKTPKKAKKPAAKKTQNPQGQEAQDPQEGCQARRQNGRPQKGRQKGNTQKEGSTQKK